MKHQTESNHIFYDGTKRECFKKYFLISILYIQTFLHFKMIYKAGGACNKKISEIFVRILNAWSHLLYIHIFIYFWLTFPLI